MVKVLTKLRIDEISAVHRGAGDGVRIMLMKRASRPDATPADVLRAFPNPRSFNEVLARMEAEAMAKADDDDAGGGGASYHPIAQLATLLVASGKFPDHAQALDHLLNTPHGAALLHRARKTEKESQSMTSHTELVRDVVKQYGIVALAKSMVQDEKSYGLNESEYTAFVTEHAQRLYPDKTPDVAFAKLFSDSGVDGVLLRKAHALTKLSVFDIQPGMVGGPDATHDAVSDTESSEAYQQLEAMAAKLRASSPWLSSEQAFARTFEDPKNAAIARKASPHPRPTTSYAWPR
jgi:hypothetical protein